MISESVAFETRRKISCEEFTSAVKSVGIQISLSDIEMLWLLLWTEHVSLQAGPIRVSLAELTPTSSKNGRISLDDIKVVLNNHIDTQAPFASLLAIMGPAVSIGKRMVQDTRQDSMCEILEQQSLNEFSTKRQNQPANSPLRDERQLIPASKRHVNVPKYGDCSVAHVLEGRNDSFNGHHQASERAHVRGPRSAALRTEQEAPFDPMPLPQPPRATKPLCEQEHPVSFPWRYEDETTAAFDSNIRKRLLTRAASMSHDDHQCLLLALEPSYKSSGGAGLLGKSRFASALAQAGIRLSLRDVDHAWREIAGQANCKTTRELADWLGISLDGVSGHRNNELAHESEAYSQSLAVMATEQNRRATASSVAPQPPAPSALDAKVDSTGAHIGKESDKFERDAPTSSTHQDYFAPSTQSLAQLVGGSGTESWLPTSSNSHPSSSAFESSLGLHSLAADVPVHEQSPQKCHFSGDAQISSAPAAGTSYNIYEHGSTLFSLSHSFVSGPSFSETIQSNSEANNSTSSVKFEEAIARLQTLRAPLAIAFRNLSGGGKVHCPKIAQALLNPPFSLGSGAPAPLLSQSDAEELICLAARIGRNGVSGAELPAPPRLTYLSYRQLLDFLDQHRTNTGTVIFESVRKKLHESATIRGDRLRLLGSVQQLRMRLKNLNCRGSFSWISNPDYCSEEVLFRLLESLQIHLTKEENRAVVHRTVSVDDSSQIQMDNACVSKTFVRLGAALTVLADLL
jgi:hypothetical protein